MWLFLILLPHGGAKSIVIMSLIVRLQLYSLIMMKILQVHHSEIYEEYLV